MRNAGFDANAAGALSRKCNVDFLTAHALVSGVWREARSCILSAIGRKSWDGLTFREKAYVCSSVVKAITDKEGLRAFLKAGGKNAV